MDLVAAELFSPGLYRLNQLATLPHEPPNSGAWGDNRLCLKAFLLPAEPRRRAGHLADVMTPNRCRLAINCSARLRRSGQPENLETIGTNLAVVQHWAELDLGGLDVRGRHRVVVH